MVPVQSLVHAHFRVGVSSTRKQAVAFVVGDCILKSAAFRNDVRGNSFSMFGARAQSQTRVRAFPCAIRRRELVLIFDDS